MSKGQDAVTATSRALPISALLAAVLLVLDLLGKITVSWWVIAAIWLAPVMLLLGGVAIGAAVWLTATIGIAIMDRRDAKRRRKAAALLRQADLRGELPRRRMR